MGERKWNKSVDWVRKLLDIKDALASIQIEDNKALWDRRERLLQRARQLNLRFLMDLQEYTEQEKAALKLTSVITELQRIHDNELNHLAVADGMLANKENQDTEEAFDRLLVAELNKISANLRSRHKNSIIANLEKQYKIITDINKDKKNFSILIIAMIKAAAKQYNNVIEKMQERGSMLERKIKAKRGDVIF
jgi:hypothetical protein